MEAGDPLSHDVIGKAVGKRRALVSLVRATRVPVIAFYRMGELGAGWRGPFGGIVAGIAQAGGRPDVRHKTARLHHAARRRGGVAARGARAAVGDAGDWIS